MPCVRVFLHLQIDELINNADNCTNFGSDNLSS